LPRQKDREIISEQFKIINSKFQLFYTCLKPNNKFKG